jgi:HEAT repeat protein
MRGFCQLCILLCVLSVYPTEGRPAWIAKNEQATVSPELQARIRKLIATLGPDPRRGIDIGDGTVSPTIEARDELVAIGKPAVLPLCEVLKAKDKWRRIMAVEALIEIRDRRAFKPLLQTLQRDASMDVRGGAAKALGNIGSKEAVPALIDALKIRSKDRTPAYLASQAAIALGKIGDPRAIAPLRALLGSREVTMQSIPAGFASYLGEAAASALAQCGTQTAPLLLEALDHQNRAVRMDAIKALGQMKEKHAVPRLLALVGIPQGKEASLDEEEAREAVRALEEIGDPRAGETLLLWLKPAKPDMLIIKALGQLREERVVAPLVEWLRQRSEWRLYPAVEALGKIGTPACMEALLDILQNGSKNKRMRVSAATALGHLKTDDALPALERTLDEALEDKDSSLSSAAALAIARIDSEYLLPYLHSPKARMRSLAAYALGEVDIRKIVPQLLTMLSNEDTRSVTLRALGKLGSPDILPQLEPFMRNEDHFTRIDAREAVIAIKRRYDL